MENQILEEKPFNKNRPWIIGGAVVVVLCCCLLIVAAVGYYSFITISSAESSPVQPVEEFAPPSEIEMNGPPSGGLANDILKNDTWQVIVPVAVGMGCDGPVGADSTVEVLQEPDANGVWVERWTVMCTSGETYDFEVEFILDDTGATFNITPLQ